MLAALPKGPSAYTPRDHPDRALRRRNLVLSLMAQEGYITPGEASSAAAKRLVVAEDEWRPDTGNEPLALDAVRVFIDSLLPDALQEGDVTVYTTLDIERAEGGGPRRAAPGRRREPRDAVRRLSRQRAGAGRARRARSAQRRHPRARRRTSQQEGLQPRIQGASSARLRVQAVRLRRGAQGGDDAGHARRRRAGRGRAGTQHLAASQLRGQLHRHDHAHQGARRLVECRRGAREPDGRDSERHPGRAAQRHLESAAELSRHRTRRRGRHAARARRGVRAVRQWRTARASAARASHRSGRRHACSGARRSRPRTRSWIHATRIS